MFNTWKIMKHQGKQFIPNLTAPKLPDIFKNGRPEISDSPCREGCVACADACPTDAIALHPLTLDLGKCVFCNECVRVCTEEKIVFTNDYKTATNDRGALIIREGKKLPIQVNPALIRKEISSYFSGSLKLRQVCAAGDNSCEWEVNAGDNVNFDMGRFGINFVASPRHADGLVITGPVSENMSEALEICYRAVPEPKIIIVVGVDAISGGIFQGSSALERSFFDKYTVDLYVPGNPPHPLTFVLGIQELIRHRKHS
jgi:Ni,Fe-hydrogenase III small subunit/NAD-dependent dihydropyrimidine dehydrogenase PreA subunit